MTNPRLHLIRIAAPVTAVAAVCAAAALLPAAGSAAGGKTQTLRVFDKTVHLQLTQADGTVITKPPYPDAGPGDVLDIASVEYAGDHARHSRAPIGTAHVQCSFPAKGGPPDCVSHVAMAGGMLVFSGDPGRVVFGTGAYLGATGRIISNTTVGNTNNSDIVARITRR